MSIAENIARIRQEIDAAARETGRTGRDITLVGASKMNGPEACQEAIAAGIDALDTVYSDVNNEEQLLYEARLIKDLGFDGKSVINPRQIAPVHSVFNPTQKDIDKAKKIVAAIKEAEARGSGVISLNGKMVDRPVVIRAQRVIELALVSGIITKEEVEAL